MRSILEQSIMHKLNGDDEKSKELFHQFIVAKARQIHESLRNGDEELIEEGFEDELVAEEFFGEDDLADLEDGQEELGAGADDFEDAEFDGVDDAEADLGDDLGLGGEEGLDGDLEGEVVDGDVEARLEDLEAELKALTQEFADKFGDEDFDDEEGEPTEFDAPEFDTEEEPELEDDMSEQPVAESDEGFDGDEEFEDLAESVASELEKIAVKLDDGKEIGAGGAITQNRKSALPQKKVGQRDGASPVTIKSSQHKGFEREAAPTPTTLKPRRNNVSKADAALSSVAAPKTKDAATQKKSPVVPTKGPTK